MRAAVKPRPEPKTLAEIYDTPPLQLTPAEIKQLDWQSRLYVLQLHSRHDRYMNCQGHRQVLIGEPGGWHRLQCKYCGMDMSSHRWRGP